MSKLVSLKRPRPGAVIQLPYPKDALVAQVTVMLLRNGQVELSGYVGDEQFATTLLTLGLKRLGLWHKQERGEPLPIKANEGEAAPPSGGSVGEPGAEAAGNGEAVPASPLPGLTNERPPGLTDEVIPGNAIEAHGNSGSC